MTALEPLFLHGQFEVSVDAKNRMLVPAAIRRRIKPESHGANFLMILGHNRKPWLYPDKFFEELVTEQKPVLTSGPAQANHDRMLATAELIEIDSQGRVLIPTRNMEWLGLKGVKDFYLLGCRHHLELWDKTEWEKERESMPARSMDIVLALLQSQKDKSP